MSKPSTSTPPAPPPPGPAPDRLETLERIARRALAYCTHMIWEANNRPDAEKGDPKVGGHPAACASSLHIATALHMVAQSPSDYYCAKPHLAPMDHSLNYMLGFLRDRDGRWLAPEEGEQVLHRLRQFPREGELVFQSYHAESDPDNWRTLPSGTVGIPPVALAYVALAYSYAQDHGFQIKGQKHFWALIGDSEFREGSISEALPDLAERELGNVTWIVDYNRQNLDGTRIPNKRGLRGTDADRIERTAAANGWEVIQIRHGRFRDALFGRPGGEAFRRVLEEGLSDYQLQALIWCRDAGIIRRELLQVEPGLAAFLEGLGDAELLRAIGDLGGHDLVYLLEALARSKQDRRVPTLIVAHTVKGWGLRSYAAPGNHSTIPSREEIEELLAAEGLDLDDPYRLDAGGWTADGPELRFLAERGRELREGIQGSLDRAAWNRERIRERLEASWPPPPDFAISIDLVPWAHTQWLWGQVAGKVVRVGTADELAAAGRNAGRELSENDRLWAELADLCLTMSPDVGTSTNINPAMDAKIYGPEAEENLEEELQFKDRGRPELLMRPEPWTRHIRFEIAEANCMTALGSFGKMGELAGVPFFPMMTVYDFFIKRALDQLYYNLYWGSSFLLVGTPAGVTLSPEGAQHSWKSDLQMPGLITWEPTYAREMEWIIADAIRRHFEGDHEDRNGVLVRGVTRALDQREWLRRLRAQPRFQGREDAELLAAVRRDVLAGGYKLVDRSGEADYRPGENVVVILTMGAVTTEALAASDRLLEEAGVHADVVVVTSADLLLGRFAARDGYRHLREGLGVTGALHLSPAARAQLAGGGLDAAEAALLAARTVPIVSVADGEEGLLDNAGSILGVRQQALAVRRFSKSGRPRDIYRYHGIDAEAVFQAAGRVLAESARAEVRLSRAALERLADGGRPAPGAAELWPFGETP